MQRKIKAAFQSYLSQMASSATREFLKPAILIFFGIGVHLPALTGEMLWDDLTLVRDNPLIKSPVLILEAFRHYLFPDAYAGHYRPIQTISYIFDYFFWNTEAFGYHLSNVVLHVLSGMVLYYLLRRILGTLMGSSFNNPFWERCGGRSTIAFFLALLWLVHPVHSAAVDYISGRADSLAFFFAATGWLFYLRAAELSSSSMRRLLYGLAATFALFSLCSRESGSLWILMFLVYLFAFEKIPNRRKLITLASCLVVLLFYFGLRQLPEYRYEDTISPGWTPGLRGVLMLRALGDYGRLLVFPAGLHVERTVFDPVLWQSSDGWQNFIANQYLTIMGLVVLAILLFGVLRKGSGQPARIFGMSWFLLAYLPMSNLFDLNATVAEHWLYLPSVGFIIFLAGVLVDLKASYARLAFASVAIAVTGLSARSVIRSSDWVDAETFFRRTFAAGGSNSRIGVNLGVIYAARGEHAKAEAILRRVLQASPDYLLARNNLGIALSNQGKAKEAEAMFDVSNTSAPAKGGYPRTWDAARNLARIRHKEKDDGAAFSILAGALREYPGNWELINLQAQMIRETEGPSSALPVVKDFVRKHWWHAGAAMTLGSLCLEMGDLKQARDAFRDAGMLDVHDAKALNLIALIEVRENKLENACKTQRRALARQPDQPRQYLILADILTRMGRSDEAQAELAEASRLELKARSQGIVN